MEKCIVFTCYETQWYNSSHVNECVNVEHDEKSLDYQQLMNVVKQCEATHHLCQ
jgi:peptide methionine sulfoxide reductase MsrA